MKCEICKGMRETLVPVIHKQTKLKTMASFPCVCFTSLLVSQENQLIQYLDEVYIHPDKLDPQLVFIPENLRDSPNFLITGEYDNFVLQIKALLMKNRFLNPKPRILFSRSIDIVQNFHVPQEDDVAPRLSATLLFDLVIIVFGVAEKNKVLAPCMAQIVVTRKEEKKPTWIYLPSLKPNIAQCEQEKSTELEEAVKDFNLIVLTDKGVAAIKNSIKQRSKKTAADFSVGK
jgi:hypothetical protein